jgi:myo-inositol 2-dehydrogenase/D-chiro-inositol 1-dehydrogenase
VAFNRRFDPHYQALKAKIDSGAIGALESLHIVNHDPATPPPAFIPPAAACSRTSPSTISTWRRG